MEFNKFISLAEGKSFWNCGEKWCRWVEMDRGGCVDSESGESASPFALLKTALASEIT
jgi:hypothetical protein